MSLTKDIITVYRGNIAKLGVDVIVNAANPSLTNGGGVNGAIHAAAGEELKNACRNLHGCAIGGAKITEAYNLPALKIIHTVGPIWQGGMANEKEILASCYINSLNTLIDNGMTSIAFPAISTGNYGFPKQLAAEIACNTILSFVKTHSQIKKVFFVVFDTETERIYKEILATS